MNLRARFLPNHIIPVVNNVKILRAHEMDSINFIEIVYKKRFRACFFYSLKNNDEFGLVFYDWLKGF